MVKLSCLYGQIHIATEKQPDYLQECNCTLCSKSGARWTYWSGAGDFSYVREARILG